MYAVILIGKKNSILRSFMEESTGGESKILVFPSLLDLYPAILTEEPLVLFIDGNCLHNNELGVIQVLKRTFPHLQVLLTFASDRRDLAAQSIIQGADGYLLEPYLMEEMEHFFRQAYQRAMKATVQSLQTRMETLSIFIQGLAPEINNLLQPILGTLQLLRDPRGKKLSKDDLEEHYRLMQAESKRIARTVAELENYAKPRIPKKKKVLVKATIDKAIAEARKDSKNSVPVLKEDQVNLEWWVIDQGQIIQALGAIIRFLKENAEEDEGRITVTVQAVEGTHLYLTIEGFRTVSLGEEVRRAFIPLYLRHIVRFGQEVGLASAYGLIGAHGGTLEAESIAHGTRFHIKLPLDEEAS